MSITSPLASRTDLSVRLADRDVPASVLDAALSDISAIARGEAGAVGTAWDPELAQDAAGYVPPRVRVVVLDATRRRVLNPDAFVAEQSGDYSYRRAEGTEGADYFTDSELRILRGFRSSSSVGGMRTVQMTRPEIGYGSIAYVPTTAPEGRLLPWSYE